MQSITSYNGAAMVAMVGKDCVAIASDLRLGVQAQTVSMDFQKIFQMGPRLMVGLPGLATDVQTVYVPGHVRRKAGSLCPFALILSLGGVFFFRPCRSQRLKFKINLYTMKEERDIEPRTFMNMISALLYEKRFGPCVPFRGLCWLALVPFFFC